MGKSDYASQEKLEMLEIKSSYQEAIIAELSSTIYEQEKRITRLEFFYKEVASKIKELSGEGNPLLLPNEKPPHY